MLSSSLIQVDEANSKSYVESIICGALGQAKQKNCTQILSSIAILESTTKSKISKTSMFLLQYLLCHN